MDSSKHSLVVNLLASENKEFSIESTKYSDGFPYKFEVTVDRSDEPVGSPQPK